MLIGSSLSKFVADYRTMHHNFFHRNFLFLASVCSCENVFMIRIHIADALALMSSMQIMKRALSFTMELVSEDSDSQILVSFVFCTEVHFNLSTAVPDVRLFHRN